MSAPVLTKAEQIFEEERRQVELALADAQDALRQYRDYGEAMREHGRGYEPTGRQGERMDTIMARVRGALTLVRRW